MLTQEELSRMKQRKIVARSSLQFFKDVKRVLSPNKQPRRQEMRYGAGILKQRAQVVTDYRNEYPISVMNAFDNAASTGLGNSLEKSSIVYSSLSCNPRILHDSLIHMCECHGYDDHMFVIITDKCSRNVLQGFFKLAALSVTTMVVDAWSGDYYFPNVNRWMESENGIHSPDTATTFMADVRYWCKTSTLAVYKMPLVDDSYRDAINYPCLG